MHTTHKKNTNYLHTPFTHMEEREIVLELEKHPIHHTERKKKYSIETAWTHQDLQKHEKNNKKQNDFDVLKYNLVNPAVQFNHTILHNFSKIEGVVVTHTLWDYETTFEKKIT